MNAYGAGWGQGYIAPDTSQSNYVSTDPSYDPYSAGSSGLSSGNKSMWGAIVGAAGSYAGAKADAAALEQNTKLSIEAKKAMLAEQRKQDLEDHDYRRSATSKWSQYFAG